MLDSFSLERLLEFRHPMPALVLPPVVRQNFLRPPKCGDRSVKHLEHQLPRLPGVHAPSHQVPRVVVQEADQIDLKIARDRESGDVRLPEFVRFRPLEGLGLLGGAFPADNRFLEEVLLLQRRVDLPKADRHKQRPPDPVQDAAHAEVGVLLLDREDLLAQLGGDGAIAGGLPFRSPVAVRQCRFAARPVMLFPDVVGLTADAVHPLDLRWRQIFLQGRLDDLDLVLQRVPLRRPLSLSPSHPDPLLPQTGLREAQKCNLNYSAKVSHSGGITPRFTAYATRTAFTTSTSAGSGNYDTANSGNYGTVSGPPKAAGRARGAGASPIRADRKRKRR